MHKKIKGLEKMLRNERNNKSYGKVKRNKDRQGGGKATWIAKRIQRRIKS